MSVIHIEDILPADGTTAFMADEIRDGWVTMTAHPSDDSLAVLCYGRLVQIKAHWDARSTLLTRGLIVRLNKDDDKDLGLAGSTVVARGMRKFFTIDQTSHYGVVMVDDDEGVTVGGADTIDFTSPATVSDKLDGALGAGYVIDGTFRLATKASFVSDEAVTGTRIVSERYDTDSMARLFDEGGELSDYTPLFEIISADINHVVNYGDMNDTVFLGLMERRNGVWHPACEKISADFAARFGLTVPELFEARSLDEALRIPEITNREGVVVTVNAADGTQTMYKVKFPKFLFLQRMKHSFDTVRTQKQIIRESDIQEVFSKDFRISDRARERASELMDGMNVDHLFDTMAAGIDSDVDRRFLAPMRDLFERVTADFTKIPEGDHRAAALAVNERPKDERPALFSMIRAREQGDDPSAAAGQVIRQRFVGRDR